MQEKELEIFQQIIIKKEHLTNFNIEYKVKEKDERFLIIDRFLFKNIKNQDRRCYILGRALNYKEIHGYKNLLNSIKKIQVIPWLNNAKIWITKLWITKLTIDIITPYVLIETNDGDYELFNFNNKNNNSIKIKNIEFHNNIIDSQQYYIQDTYEKTFYEISKNLNKEIILKIKNKYNYKEQEYNKNLVGNHFSYENNNLSVTLLITDIRIFSDKKIMFTAIKLKYNNDYPYYYNYYVTGSNKDKNYIYDFQYPIQFFGEINSEQKIKNIYFLKNKNRILDNINTLELKPSFKISSLDLLIIQKQISRNKRQHSGFLFPLTGYQIEIDYDEKEKQKFLILNNEKINSKKFFINYIKSKKQSIENNKEELFSYYDDYDKSEVYKITYDEDDLYSEIWNIKNIILKKIEKNEKTNYYKKITFNTSKKFISEEDGLKIINNSKLTTTSKPITTQIIYTDNNLKDFFILLDDQELYNKENKKNIQEVKRLIKITFNEQILTSENNYKDELKNQNIKCEIIEANNMNNDLKNIKCLRTRKENDSYDAINSDKINNFIQTVLIDENEIENKIIKNCIKKYKKQFIKNNKQEIDNYLKKMTELLEDEFLRKLKINVKKLEDFEIDTDLKNQINLKVNSFIENNKNKVVNPFSNYKLNFEIVKINKKNINNNYQYIEFAVNLIYDDTAISNTTSIIKVKVDLYNDIKIKNIHDFLKKIENQIKVIDNNQAEYLEEIEIKNFNSLLKYQKNLHERINLILKKYENIKTFVKNNILYLNLEKLSDIDPQILVLSILKKDLNNNYEEINSTLINLKNSLFIKIIPFQNITSTEKNITSIYNEFIKEKETIEFIEMNKYWSLHEQLKQKIKNNLKNLEMNLKKINDIVNTIETLKNIKRPNFLKRLWIKIKSLWDSTKNKKIRKEIIINMNNCNKQLITNNKKIEKSIREIKNTINEQKKEWSKRVANALGFEKDKSKVNSEASTSKSQSSSSKSQKM